MLSVTSIVSNSHKGGDGSRGGVSLRMCAKRQEEEAQGYVHSQKSPRQGDI